MNECHALSAESRSQQPSSDVLAVKPGRSGQLQRRDKAGFRHISPITYHGRSGQIEASEARLLQFKEGDEINLEFSSHSHSVVFFPDGIFGEAEWGNEVRSQRISSSPPGTIVFNPQHKYLLLKVRKVKYAFQALLLLIEPASLNCSHDGKGHTSSPALEQRIDVRVEEVTQTLRRIHDELRCPGLYTASYVHALIMLTLAGLMRGLSSQESLRRSVGEKGGLPNWRLKQALERLESGRSAAPTLAELARPLKLHPTSFCRAFKQSMGLPPHRYLLLCRVNRAKEMMKDPDRSLTEIALDCGFNSSSQFSVVFKRIEGISPRSFRRSI